MALARAGYDTSSYIAFEIDKYAKAISRYNNPNALQCGDVLDADFRKYAGYDIVMGGSPCTFWSIAKHNREVNKDGKGWALFMRFVEAVRQIQPRYFLYENVASMPSNIKDFISEEFGCEPVYINSALVSAQHRKRLYWTNIKDITQPCDMGLLLNDILDTGYDDTADKSQNELTALYREKALSTVKNQKTGLSATGEVGAALRTRADENGSFKRLEVRNDGKLNAITTVLTDSVICSPVRIGSIGSGSQGHRVYSVYGKTVSLMANGGGRGAKTGLYKVNLPDGDYTVRKLTAIEAERCQTLPDNFTALGIDDSGKTVKISDTQRYRAVGNAWTVDVIAHIFSHMV